ncbi:MAG: sugar phosphate isomerase/epimerase family protein [Armatimonadota bacterium]
MFKNLSPGAVGISGSMEEVMTLAKRNGFRGIDLNVGEAIKIAEQSSLDDVRKMFDDHRLKPGGFGLPVDFRKDEDTYRHGLERLPAIAETAAAVGCTRCPTWILPWSDDLPFDENFEQHRRRLKGCAEILKDHGIRLGLEFVGPKTSREGHKYEFIWDMDGMLKLADAIGTGNVGLLLDCWHWYTSHGTLDDLKGLRNEDVVYIHVNDAPEGVPVDEQIDNVRRLPGETGVIDIAGFLQAMDAIGYDGPVTPEPFVPELREMGNERAARIVGDSMKKIFDLAGLS